MTFYLRCALCEFVMDTLDRIGLGRTRLYDLLDKPYDIAWNRLQDAKDEIVSQYMSSRI